MVTRQINIVDVQERDDFDDLLHRLELHAASTVTIDIAADVDVLSIPAEFEELLDAAGQHNVRVEIATDDPLRQELARIYGLLVVTATNDDSTTIFRSTETLPFVSHEHIPAPAKAVPPTEEFPHVDHPGRAHYVAPTRRSPFDTDASFSFVVAPPTRGGKATSVAAPARTRPASRPKSLTRSIRWGSLVVSGIVVAMAIAVLLTALLAPAAEITIVPETRPVVAEVTYGLAGSSQPLDVEVAPTIISDTMEYEATVPASGEMLVPDAMAHGMVFVSNPFSQVIEIPAGTHFQTPDGSVQFVSVESVEVPAADPFQSAQFGTAVVEIEATEPGLDGNVGVGALSGVLDSGILFQNRFPIEGGTMKTVAVATVEDMKTLRVAAQNAFDSSVVSALESQVPSGWEYVDAPRLASDIAFEFSAEAGDVVDEVRVLASVDVRGSVYDPAALEAAAHDALLGKLAHQVPDGFGLAMDSIRTSLGQPLSAASGAAFVIDGEGTAMAQFEPDFRDDLSSELVGKSQDRAIEILTGVPGVSSFSVNYGPDWLPWEPVPRIENRVTVTVDGS